MRLIDAGKAKLSLDWTLIGDAADAACRVIDNATTVDAVPIQDLVQLRDELLVRSRNSKSKIVLRFANLSSAATM